MRRKYDIDIESKVIELRNKNYGYHTIATILNMKRDAVRYYCSKNNLNGVMGIEFIKLPKDYTCKFCGKTYKLKDNDIKLINISYKDKDSLSNILSINLIN